jgi:hypothetical protein
MYVQAFPINFDRVLEPVAEPTAKFTIENGEDERAKAQASREHGTAGNISVTWFVYDRK